MNPTLGDGSRLQPHQAEAIEWLRFHQRTLLAHGTGLGKTVTAIGHILELHWLASELGFKLDPIYWITEANLIDQTRREFERFAPSLKVFTSEDRLYSNQTPKGRQEYLAAYGPQGPDVVIVSYGKIKHSQALTRRFGMPSLIVFDEAMAVKGGGVTADNVRALTDLSPRVLAMTATPMEMSPMETFQVLKAMSLPDLWTTTYFKDTFVTWSEEYQHPVTGYWVAAKPIGVREENLPELREYLSRYMHRVTTDQVHADLPVWDMPDGIEFVPLTAAQKRAVRDVAKSGGVGHILKQGAARSFGEDSALVDRFIELLTSEFAEEPKVIAYCENLDPIRLLCDRLDALGIGYREIQGATNQSKRTQSLEDFEHDPSVRVLVGSKVLETGLNLQHCRVLISLDCSDNPMRERQREGRIQRIGSPHQTVTHVTLVPDIPQARQRLARLQQREADASKVLKPLAARGFLEAKSGQDS